MTKLPATAITGLLNMPSRYLDQIDTGVALKAPLNYRLRFDIVNELSRQGLLVVSVDTEDTVKVSILNASRNIITLGEGVPFVKVSLEKVVKVDFE